MKRFTALLIIALIGAVIYQKKWVKGSDVSTTSTPKVASVLPEAYGNSPAVTASTNISDMAEIAVKSVVNISSVKIIRYKQFSPFGNDPFFEFFFRGSPQDSFGVPRERREQSMGSGVIVNKEQGLILTNNHVIERASEVTVTLSDQTQLPAKLIGTDPHTDLAVIKVKLPANAQPMPLGNSDQLRLAESVLAIGSPFGLGGTVTLGIVSAKGRNNVGIVDYEDFIQTDAAINPGNSGGALVNLNGQLVGINTAIYSKSGGYQGIGFAIPINLAQNIMNQLVEKGKIERGWIGLQVENMTDELARKLGTPQSKGVIVVSLYENSPAHRAGVEPYMVITEFNGEKISHTGDFNRLLYNTPVGGSVKLKVFKGKTSSTATMTMEALPTRQGRET